MSATPLKELTNSLHELFTGGSYSDLTIRCGDDQYKVHKAIVCPRSCFFATACNDVFEEDGSGIVTLQDDDPTAVKMMMHYFYHLDYPRQAESNPPLKNPRVAATSSTYDNTSLGGGSSTKKRKASIMTQGATAEFPNLTVHAKVYALGEKYGIGGLKTLALEKFTSETHQHWHTEDFIRAAREVYASPVDHDRAMKEVVVRTISKHPSLLDEKQVQELIKSLDMAFDLLMKVREYRY